MKFNSLEDNKHPGYGYVFDVDFNDVFEKYNIDTNEIPLEDSSPMQGKLPQNDKRQVVNVYDIRDTSFYKFYNEYVSNQLLVDMINLDETTQRAFTRDWPFRHYESTLQFLNHYVKLGAMICIDKKGFKLGRHCDNRLVMGSFVINLDDNVDSTNFFLDGEVYHSGPTEYGKGVFFFNNEYTKHSIEINNQDLRKALIMNVTIKH